MVFDKIDSLYTVWYGIVEKRLEDLNMKMSHNHRCDDVLVSLWEIQTINQIRVFSEKSRKSISIEYVPLRMGQESMSIIITVLQPGFHELLYPVLNLFNKSIIILNLRLAFAKKGV